ncbi:MAG: hypothetical protein U1A07_22960, partial [Phenylobacterium sp.]|nr:hypothetical protein [Phenylobacterium sp.]
TPGRLEGRQLRAEVLEGGLTRDVAAGARQGAGVIAAEPVEEEGLPAQGSPPAASAWNAAWARLESASIP